MPQWKHVPPCEAHKILSQMFADGKIEPTTTPKAAYSFHPEFSKYTLAVFYNNFRQLRQLNGLECMYLKLFISLCSFRSYCYHNSFIFFLVKNSEKNSSLALSCLDDSSNSASSSSLVPANKRPRDDKEPDLKEDEIEDLDCRLIYTNQPVLMAVYKDHTLAEIVSICVGLPSGVTDICFTLVGAGPATTLASITYTWPQVMYEIEGLFASAISKKTMAINHPKIIALKLELENNRKHENRKPQGSIEVSLPIPVKTDPDSITYKLAKGTDGVIVLMADLCAFHRAYIAIKPEFRSDFEDF
jgi:hypothetical protein